MKIIIKLMLAAIGLLVLSYGVLFYQNNRTADTVGDEKVTQSYERSVEWLLNNREKILSEHNVALWAMLEESARISGDERVRALFEEFMAIFNRTYPYSVWQARFYPERFRNAVFSASEYSSLVEYQQYFLYTLTCSTQLAQEPEIASQNNPNFCWQGSRIVRPACVTHQMMGYRLAQKSQCSIDNLQQNIAVLQGTIEKQLRYDPRVVDVYIQRVLMLVDSGAEDRVEPRWLERVIAAQLPGGGWSDVHPLIPLGGNRYLGFNGKGLTLTRPISTFHATAQGVLLMSYLKSH